MSHVTKFLRNQDSHGHKMNINFYGKSVTVKTPIGGALTLFFKLISLAYLVKQLFVMFSLGDTQINLFEHLAEQEDVESVTYEEF
jgi:hypothetical protein